MTACEPLCAPIMGGAEPGPFQWGRAGFGPLFPVVLERVASPSSHFFGGRKEKQEK